jgi:hypothetical protein
MIIEPLLVIVLAYNELFSKNSLWTSLYELYTLGGPFWQGGVLCAPCLPLEDSFSQLDALGTSPIVGKNREAENDESLIAENQRPPDSYSIKLGRKRLSVSGVGGTVILERGVSGPVRTGRGKKTRGVG